MTAFLDDLQHLRTALLTATEHNHADMQRAAAATSFAEPANIHWQDGYAAFATIRPKQAIGLADLKRHLGAVKHLPKSPERFDVRTYLFVDTMPHEGDVGATVIVTTGNDSDDVLEVTIRRDQF